MKDKARFPEKKGVGQISPAWKKAFLSRRPHKSHVVFAALLLLTFALGSIFRPIGAGYLFSQANDHVQASNRSEAAIPTHPGPWGDLELVPITIAAPEELLPVRTMTEQPTRWFFSNFSHDDLVRFLDELDLTANQKDELLKPAALQVRANGIEITPPPELIVALPEKARRGIYTRLAGTPNNEQAFEFVLSQTIDDRFSAFGVSSETAALFKKMCCPYGDYLVFCGMSSMLSAIPTYEERLRFAKALSRQKTLLARLHINSKTDVNALVHYWGKGNWATNTKALLDSVAALPGDNTLDLVELLPPLPTRLLYTFPPLLNTTSGAPARHDCHWTSMNFFRDVPDDRFSDPDYVKQKLTTDYVSVPFDPRFGDVVVLQKPNGDIVHSAVYLADNVVFTKNGDTQVHPWMLSTIDDMKEQYSYAAPPGQKLVDRYFRSK